MTLLFEHGLETTSSVNGLIGGVAQNDVKKIVLSGGSKKMTIPLTTDNGYLWGCPAPTSCAKWVRLVLGYNAAGKLVSPPSPCSSSSRQKPSRRRGAVPIAPWVSRSSAFGALLCVALITAFAARAPGAKAWGTASRTSAAATRISHAGLGPAHGSKPGASRKLTRRSQLRILPLLRHVGSHPARAAAHVKHPSTPQPAPAPQASLPSTVLPNDPDWSQQWSLRQVGAPAAWALVPGAARPVVVAVVDSGVDPSQPDLQGALVPGADFADSSGSTADQYGHGTMVAGVIAARGNNGQGVAGACWNCLVMPIKVLDGSGAGSAASVAAGIRWAADHGANVINLSFVLSGPDTGVEAAIADAHAHGVLVVAAAGNAGSAAATYPASYPFVVSVAATDGADQLYPWSSHGSWVTLAAPGCTTTTALGGGFANFCGTSAAAPLVAGLAALGLEAGAGSEAALEAALERTATPLPGAVGSGRVDALALVQAVRPLIRTWTEKRRRARRSGPFASFRVRTGRARYAIATRTVLTDGASFRFGTRTTWFVATVRSTMWLLPFLLTSVMRSVAVFAELFTRAFKKRPDRVLTTRAETSVIVTFLATDGLRGRLDGRSRRRHGDGRGRAGTATGGGATGGRRTAATCRRRDRPGARVRAALGTGRRVEVEVTRDARATVAGAKVLDSHVDARVGRRVDVDRSLAGVRIGGQVDVVRVARVQGLTRRVIATDLVEVGTPAVRVPALRRLQGELDVRLDRVALEVGDRLDAVRLVGRLRDAVQDLARGEVHGLRDLRRELRARVDRPAAEPDTPTEPGSWPFRRASPSRRRSARSNRG